MKRRKPRRIYNPQGLADIPKNELAHWKVYGPVIGEEGYPSWEEWARVYEGCREELLAGIESRRRRLLAEPRLRGLVQDAVPACEQIYLAMQEGKDPGQVQAAICGELKANDPRGRLGK